MTPDETSHIIQTGILSGYSIGGGFLQVQWTTPKLKQGEFWLFKFTSADNNYYQLKMYQLAIHLQDGKLENMFQ